MSVLAERSRRIPPGRDPSDATLESSCDENLLRAASYADDVDDFDMRHLRYFLAVVRAGTVSAAARELRISQPSLSQQIRRLEQRVGAPLFIRGSRGVELTAGGRAFLREIQGIPGQLRSAIAAAAPISGLWPVGVCGGVPAEVLEEVQKGLVEHASELVGQSAGSWLRMRSVSAGDQLDLLRHGELSFGIVRLPFANPDLVQAVVWDEPLGVVMRAEHPLAERTSLTWDDLATQRLLWYDEGCAPGYADSVPAQLADMGWTPALHPIDQDQHALFVHAIQTTADVVALRPGQAVRGDARLVWRRLPTDSGPRERLAVTALAGGRPAHVLRRVAAERDWQFIS